jgi:hypothetical protein
VDRVFRVTGSAGTAGTISMPLVFAIYDTETGGAPLWQEVQTVPLGALGEYSAVLGATSPEGLPAEVFGTGGPRWLSVQAPGVPEGPRTRITSVPYAQRAASAANADMLGGLPASAFLRAPGRSATATVTQRLGAGGAAIAPLVNSGTAGYLGKFTNAVDLGNSVLFENAGSLGLGTTTPLANLHVVGNSAGSVGMAVQNIGSGLSSTSGYHFYTAQGALAAYTRFSNASNILFFNNSAASGSFDFALGGASKFRIAADGRIGVAQHDVVRGGDDRLHAAAAEAVQRQRAGGNGQPAVDAGEPRDVHVARFGVDDVAHHALADVLRVGLGAGHRFLDDAGRELGRRNVLQAAAIVTDGRAHAAQYDDFPVAHRYPPGVGAQDHTRASGCCG